MTTSESKGRFFYKTNRFAQRIESRIGMLYQIVVKYAYTPLFRDRCSLQATERLGSAEC